MFVLDILDSLLGYTNRISMVIRQRETDGAESRLSTDGMYFASLLYSLRLWGWLFCCCSSENRTKLNTEHELRATGTTMQPCLTYYALMCRLERFPTEFTDFNITSQRPVLKYYKGNTDLLPCLFAIRVLSCCILECVACWGWIKSCKTEG